MNRAVVIAMVMFLIFLPLLSSPSEGASAGMHVEGPSIAATNSNVTYTVIISGIFDMYRCTMLMSGGNLTGASPLNQVEKVSHEGFFKFTITTPNATQRIYLDFKAYGIINSTGKTKVFERRIYVDIKESYTIVATVKNPENYTVQNVTVNFYIDDRYVGNATIDKIEANSTARVTYKWVPDVTEGEHKLKMEIVDDGIVFQNNQRYYVRSIYVGTPPNYDWVGYLGIAVLAAAISFLVFMLLGRKKGREAKPKWKK